MKTKTKKFLLIVFLISVTLLGHSSFAMSIEDISPAYTPDSKKIEGFGKEVLGIIINIAALSSVAILAYIGLRFMFGSVEQKAEYKKSLLPLAIGMLIVLSATTITRLVWKL